jgi:putative AlgH/UPF0301 family transcriptional regulator
MEPSKLHQGNLVVKRLYRNLLRTARPFVSSPDAAVLTSLLQRTGIDDCVRSNNNNNETYYDHKDSSIISTEDDLTRGRARKEYYARDLTFRYADKIPSYATTPHGGGSITSTTASASPKAASSNRLSSSRDHHQLFRLLLREVMTGPAGYAKMVFPSQVDPTTLQRVIQREFRNHLDGCVSQQFDNSVRLLTAFTALQELNKKLAYFTKLQKSAPTPSQHQAALRVSPLSTDSPLSYLRPGAFLVAHPYLNDLSFSKAVICILDHQPLHAVVDDTNSLSSDYQKDDNHETLPSAIQDYRIPGQTYGLIINQVSIREGTGRIRTMNETFRERGFPEELTECFGNASVRIGGPVHPALQMIHSLSPSQQDQQQHLSSSSLIIGGRLIPEIADQESVALYSDRATYFQGNVLNAKKAVEDGNLDREDISFYVGASTWSPGQLAHEIAQGFWIPCRGPPEMVLHGICEHDEQPTTTTTTTTTGGTGGGSKRPLTDLWLSMLSACGEEEAKLGHLFYHEYQWDENGQACDIFDDIISSY